MEGKGNARTLGNRESSPILFWKTRCFICQEKWDLCSLPLFLRCDWTGNDGRVARLCWCRLFWSLGKTPKQKPKVNLEVYTPTFTTIFSWKFSKQTLPFATNWGGISRQGAKDALKNFLMTAQKLDAQNATSRLSQVERFRSQVWAFTPRKKPDKKTQARQIIWHCTKNRT